jgi:Zn-dependent protease with chaperone function
MTETTGSSKRRAWLTAVVLVLLFPVVGFAIGTAVEAKIQGDLYTVIEEDIGRPLTAEERGQFAIADVCREPELAGDPTCTDMSLASVTRIVAVVGAILGVLLLAFITFVTARARRDRDALLRLFLPGLYIVLVSIALLVVLDGVLAFMAVYLGLGVLGGRIFPIILLGIAIGVLLGVAGVIRAMLTARRRATSSVIARRVDAAAEPGLHAMIGEIADRVGVGQPDHVLVGLDPEFYVTEADIEAPDGKWTGRSVYLSLPLMRILTLAELRAVIGHEMGHFRGQDTAYSRRFYPVYRGTGQAIGALASAGGGGGARGIALYPALLLLDLFMSGFAVPERAISRDREVLADGAGVEVASARDLASSLVKLYAFTPAWGATLDDMASDLDGDKPTANAGDRFVGLVRSSAGPSSLDGLDGREIPHPTDSHPPLSQRLEALGLSVADVASDALAIAPEPAADVVVTDRAGIGEALTATLGERIKAYLAMLRATAGS